MSDPTLRILLVRHGESAVNVNSCLTQEVADHAVPLTENGQAQARRAGLFIRRFFEDLPSGEPVRLWQSPYKRARQTADAIMRIAGDVIRDRREHINLVEQQFGLFDGIPDKELPLRFPAEYAHYRKCEEHSGKFWARMPLGESRFDVAVRVREFFPELHQDLERHGIANVVVVSHGVTIRAFLMQWLHLSPEWFEAERNPGNCFIRLIEGEEDAGTLYRGEPLPTLAVGLPLIPRPATSLILHH